MDKKIIIIAAVLLGGAACVYAVTDMSEEELSASEPEEDSIVEPPTAPPMAVDAGVDPERYLPDEPEGVLEPTLERLLDEGVLSRGPDCGTRSCERTEVCCVNTLECIDRDDALSCPGPDGQLIEPPVAPQ